MAFVPPEDLHEYRIVRLLGRGAMGAVYLGHDTVLDRAVAIKFIDAVGPDAIARERFLVEARAIARLQHPNVAAVHRVGEWAGQPYLVTEYVAGHSLAELQTPLPWARVLRIGIDLARGLSAAHRRGVVHRDVKPANAQCAEDGSVKLVDFGIAKIVDQLPGPGGQRRLLTPLQLPRVAADRDTLPTRDAPQTRTPRIGDSVPTAAKHDGLTRTGALLGTPRYLAPEVWSGQDATPRSDVYSAGAVLYELASGRPPHTAATLEALQHLVTTTDVAPLLAVAPSADARFAAAVDRCLRRDPDARFAAGDQLALAFEEIQRGEQGTLAEARAHSPYRGLLAFEAAHRDVFFGRAEEVGAVLELLRAEPAVLVAGDSGVGKSSLCRAGLLPLIEDGGLGEGRKWRCAALFPGRHPIEGLRAALAPLLPELRQWPELLRGPPERLSAALAERGAAGEGVVIFVDQAEELITQSTRDEADQLARLLGHLGARHPGVRLLLAARGDFLTRLAALPGLGAVISRGIYFLGPPSPSALREAIVGPARRSGVAFESEAMVAELASSAAGAEGSLPLLQFALAELWEHRDRERGVIPAKALADIGGVSGALARHADAVVQRMLPAQRRVAQRILTGLVTPEGTRARLQASDASSDADAAAVVESLVQGRLLTARETDAGTTLELAHEALLGGWATLRAWLAADGERRLWRKRVEAGAAEWERLHRAPDALFRGQQLAEVAALRSDDAELTGRARSFLVASRSAGRRQRALKWAALVGVPLALAVAYAAFSLQQRMDRDRAVGGRLAAAQAAMAEARRKSAEVDALRAQAFAAYDGRDFKRGEEIFAQATSRAEDVRAAWAKIGRDVESTFLLQARLGEVRNFFAEVLFEEILASERDRPAAPRDDLLQRLANFDEGGGWRSRLDARGLLRVTSSPPGARVVAETYQRRDGKLVASAPVELGVAPWEGPLPAGSYRLTLHLAGRPGVRYPVRLGRGETLAVDVRIPRSVPEGMVYVPAGRFLYGAGDDEVYRRHIMQTVQPQHESRTGAYFIGRHEVTFGDWLRFLRELPSAERKVRLPAVRGYHGELRLEEPSRGVFRLLLRPTQKLFTLSEGEKLRYPDRDRRVEQDWLRFPVTGMTLDDVGAYLRWLDRSGRIRGARLCTEHEWERAARGADERLYPHGDVLEPDDANHDATYGRKPLAFGPDEVGSHPQTLSPFDAADMAGNVWEWVSSAAAPAEVVYRGGAWYQVALNSRGSNREVGEPTMRDLLIGFRVCATAAPG